MYSTLHNMYSTSFSYYYRTRMYSCGIYTQGWPA